LRYVCAGVMIGRCSLAGFLLFLCIVSGLCSASGASAQDPAESVPRYRPAPETRATGAKRSSTHNTSIKDAGAHRRPFALALLGYVPWFHGIGIGVSTAFEIPIVHDGFIPRLNDAFSIEPSFGFAYLDHYGDVEGDYALLFRPALGAKWSFYLLPALRVYALLSFGYSRVNHYFEPGAVPERASDDLFYGDLGAGVEWSFAAHAALRAEVAPQGLRAGVSILF
jgi:hypothetical protein